MKDVKTVRKKFCSDLCRVNFNNELKCKKEPIEQKIKEYFSRVTPDEIIAQYESLGYTFKPKLDYKNLSKKFTEVLNNVPKDVIDKLDLENKHPLWKQGDPKENSGAFFLKYGCSTYEELKNLKK